MYSERERYVMGERSESLSRVFNDQPRDIYICILFFYYIGA